MARALQPFRLLQSTTKAFCLCGGRGEGRGQFRLWVSPSFSWQKAQKTFRTTPQKPNSLKRSAEAAQRQRSPTLLTPSRSHLQSVHNPEQSNNINASLVARKERERESCCRKRKQHKAASSRAKCSKKRWQKRKKEKKKIRALTRAGVKSSSDAGSGKVFPALPPSLCPSLSLGKF